MERTEGNLIVPIHWMECRLGMKQMAGCLVATIEQMKRFSGVKQTGGCLVLVGTEKRLPVPMAQIVRRRVLAKERIEER
jgi:hypothetical protein